MRDNTQTDTGYQRLLSALVNIKSMGPSVTLGVLVTLNVLMAVILRLIGSQMYGFFITVYMWAGLYALFLYSMLRWQRLRGVPLINTQTRLALIVLLTCAIRLPFLWLEEYISLDPLWYTDFGKFMMRGSIPYFEFYFPYPPVFAYLILLIAHISLTVDAFRVLAITLDAGVLLLLWSIARRLSGESHASIVACAYALLPVSVIESGWNGHFEPLANLFLLISIWAMLQQRGVLAGTSLGLAAATKVYPVLLFPMILVSLYSLREKIKFIVSMSGAAIATGLPIVLLYLSESGSSTGGESATRMNPSALINAMIGSLIRLTPETTLITILALSGIVAGAVIVARQPRERRSQQTYMTYQWVCMALGIVFIGCGLIAGVYPFLPPTRTVYWRYPGDIAIIRGVTTISLGIVILRRAAQRVISRARGEVACETLFMLIAALSLLFALLMRDVFYGWYLLWSLPLFLLVRDRRLVLTAVLTLMLLYPSYTYDNFATLNIEGTRIWSDEFETVDGWSTRVLFNGQERPNSSVLATITTDGEIGRLSFNTTAVTNMTQLDETAIEFSRPVTIQLNAQTEFVGRLSADWNPTFGPYAYIELRLLGLYDNGTLFNSTVIFRSGSFTNLTFVRWFYSFALDLNADRTGTVTRILILVYPQRPVMGAYLVDCIYITTSTNEIMPHYIVTIPSLIILTIIPYTLLKRELGGCTDDT